MNNMEYIRKANKNDISRIAEILIFTKRMNYRFIFHNDKVSFGEMQVLPLAESFLQDLSLLNNYYVYDDEFVKGIIKINENEVNELYVDSFFQSQEIGGRLLDFAVNNKKASHLWILEKNENAISFYKRHGFALTNERKFQEGTTEYIVKMVR